MMIRRLLFTVAIVGAIVGVSGLAAARRERRQTEDLQGPATFQTMHAVRVIRSVRRIDTTDPWAAPDEISNADPEASTTPSPAISSGRGIESVDPWTVSYADYAAENLVVFVPHARPIDRGDPWERAAAIRPLAPSAPPAASTRADQMLREAIKAAVDAGELDRAAELIRILKH